MKEDDRMVTMADVARLAGVHASTVSHVLNETRTVNEETRRRVLEAIEFSGYRHNVLARSLARSRSMVLGLAISSVANPYIGELIRAVETGARKAGYTLMLADTYDDAKVERQVVTQLVDRRVDGILLIPAPDARHGAVPFLGSAAVPTVLVDRFVDADFDQIAPENTGPTERITRHLADLGHRRVAMVAGLKGLHSTIERQEGYLRVVRERDLDRDPELILDGASDTRIAEREVLRLFSRPQRPSAVVVGNNAMTIGTMRAFRALGLRVPQDVALVCFDDFEWADLFEPRLTAVRQDVEKMGRMSLDLMIRRLADPDAATLKLRLETTFQHRASCGCDAEVSAPSPAARSEPARSPAQRADGQEVPAPEPVPSAAQLP